MLTLARQPYWRWFAAPITRREVQQAHLADAHRDDPTSKGKVYLCAIKDVCSGRIVGYSIADR